MLLVNRWRVGPKLFLLAGVPVLGILALSALVVLEARERAEAAAGLGSIEAMAQLTDRMLRVIDELQWERAEVAFYAGSGRVVTPEVRDRQRATDAAFAELTAYLGQLDRNKLPAKLRQDLEAAYQQLETLPAFRGQHTPEEFDALAHLEFFAKANDSLIAAMAALTQLSEDKQLLLSIGSLVSSMQVIERKAREHALLNYVFGKQEFPPGTFRYFVTLLTEQQVYTDSLRTWASEEEFARLDAALQGPRGKQIAEMRQVALETTDGAIPVDAQTWFYTQRANMEAFAQMTRNMSGAVRAVVAEKMAAVQRAVRLALGLVLGVVLASVAIGWAITRGLTRSVRVLSLAAENVHKNHDFTIRAEKTSSDELGLLTDAFNGMLAGIQERDRELETHRQNLEALVDARTRELSNKNEEMALVLDNVDQGLAMIDRTGQFLGDPSRAFKETFGTPAPGTPFYALLAKDDDPTSFRFESGYEQMIADVIPIALALDQLPKRLVRDGHTYDVAFRPVLHAGELAGALLVTRDVTLELEARRLEAEQRERVRIFERLMRDRAGFQEFFEETRSLITRLEAGQVADTATAARILHTFKGTTAVFDVGSLSELAHELEQALAEHDTGRVALARQRLFAGWEVFRNLVGPLVGEGAARPIEVSPIDLADLIDAVRAQAPHSQLLRDLVRLTYEPVSRRFERMADQIKRVARRLHKPEPLVVIDAGGARIPAKRFRPFWSTLAHVIRNMADHGFEREADRIQQGKPQQNRVELRARLGEQGLVIEISDDGRGIDWARLEEKARKKGLPVATSADLVDALFADGVSTVDTVTETSGRGIGMSAVRQSCLELGGTISVHSERGRGTRFRFFFPPFVDSDIDTRTLSKGEQESLHPALVAI